MEKRKHETCLESVHVWGKVFPTLFRSVTLELDQTSDTVPVTTVSVRLHRGTSSMATYGLLIFHQSS